MFQGDPARIALLARQGRLHTIQLTLFRPLQVMLAGVEPDADAVSPSKLYPCRPPCSSPRAMLRLRPPLHPHQTYPPR